MLPVSIRDRLSELSGAELKVWLCYRSHANAEGIAWPGRELLGKETGLSNDTISAARAGLGRKRWLVPAQVARNSRPSTGKFGSPRFMPVIPSTVTDIDRVGISPSRNERATDLERDGENKDYRDREKPFYRDVENRAYRDGEMPSLSSSNEVVPKELFPGEGEEAALRASPADAGPAPWDEVEDSDEDEVPEHPESLAQHVIGSDPYEPGDEEVPNW